MKRHTLYRISSNQFRISYDICFAFYDRQIYCIHANMLSVSLFPFLLPFPDSRRSSRFDSLLQKCISGDDLLRFFIARQDPDARHKTTWINIYLVAATDWMIRAYLFVRIAFNIHLRSGNSESERSNRFSLVWIFRRSPVKYLANFWCLASANRRRRVENSVTGLIHENKR